DEYARANDIAHTLEQIANLPALHYRARRLWVIVNPPKVPAARIDQHHRLTDEHTPVEIQQTHDAATVRSGDTFRDQLIAAARLGWDITPATTEAEHTARVDRYGNVGSVRK